MVITTKTGKRIDTGIMTCDFCRRPIAIAGIKIKEEQFGEYQVKFFSCPHCGHRFNSGTFDNKQRELIKEQQKNKSLMVIGRKKKWRAGKIEEHRRKMLEATDTARERNKFLAPIGDRLLNGEPLEAILHELETRDGGGENVSS